MGEGKEENEIMKFTTQEANEAGGKGQNGFKTKNEKE